MEEKVQALRDLLDGTLDEQLDIPDELLDEIEIFIQRFW